MFTSCEVVLVWLDYRTDIQAFRMGFVIHDRNSEVHQALKLSSSSKVVREDKDIMTVGIKYASMAYSMMPEK